ncbi:Pentatricopeptide repeat-containing protein At5g02830 [Durusdinium trenchii]|uniref:Chloroplastic n=1 Tax=Durusdinium trenchii TaxID=1381693 RepID=A0ABP0HUF0_9DINO
MLSACDGAHWPLALQLLDEIHDAQLKPDAVCYSAAIAACDQGQQWQLALQLLRQSEPNVVAYSAAVSACRKSGQWPWALHLLREMRRFELESNLVTYNAAIGACEECGSGDIGRAVVSGSDVLHPSQSLGDI